MTTPQQPPAQPLDLGPDIDPDNPFVMRDGSRRYITADEHALRRTSRLITEKVLRENVQADSREE